MLIENFRPGAMEGWGLGPDVLQAANPALIMLRISGYGQTGPYRDRPGFGVVAEAMGGLRHLTGEPGRVPVRVGVSIGDTLASLHGVIGILMALQHRHKTVSADAPQGPGPGDRRGPVRGGVQLHGKPAARIQRVRCGARARRAAPCPASRRPMPTSAAMAPTPSSPATATASSSA